MISGPLANTVGLGSGRGVEGGAGVRVGPSLAVGCGGGEISRGGVGSETGGIAQAATMKERPHAAARRGLFLGLGMAQAQEYIAALQAPRVIFTAELRKVGK